MKFTGLVSFFVTVASVSVLVAATPVATLSRSDITGRCSGCDSTSELVIQLVDKLHSDVSNTLALLDNYRATGSNPTELFTRLTSQVNQCNNAMSAVGVNSVDVDPKSMIQNQVSTITGNMILDMSAGCSKFRNVNIKDFDYAALSSKLDMALKELCVALEESMEGSLALISAMCLPKSMLLWEANMARCLTTFTTITL
ncbi:transmembrane protein, putative, partial [Rhizoctonia solani AG-3 Rhs1AP]